MHHDPPKPNFYKSFLILFSIKECRQSNSIAKVDFGAIFKMATSENKMYLILICNYYREVKLVSKAIFVKVHKYNGSIIWPIVAFARF